MACWIALHLPYLALEIAASFTPADAQTTVVLAQSRVWQAGEAARAAGVQNGMRRGGVLALLPQARFHDRDEAAERVEIPAYRLGKLVGKLDQQRIAAPGIAARQRRRLVGHVVAHAFSSVLARPHRRIRAAAGYSLCPITCAMKIRGQAR